MTALIAILSILVFTPDVTKEDVKKLVAAGISDDVIVEYIRSHGPVCALSTEDLIELRHSKVSDRVLSAMVAASKAAPTTSPEPLDTPAADPNATLFYPYGSITDYYFTPYFWWYVGPGSPLYPYWPYRSRYPYYHRYYQYPRYPYGYHWQPPRPYPPHHEVNPHQTRPSHPPAAPHSTPHGGGKH